MSQTDILLAGEADAWFERNRDKLGLTDPVASVMRNLRIQPKSVLEIGCANGWRLKRMHEEYRCTACGIDPSAAAVAEARNQPGIHRVAHGVASRLPFMPDTFDLVIFGFCLYLCDREDLFTIVAEADRVLKDRGHLIIHDFADIEPPFARPYEHRAGMLAYHMDYARLWLAHPWYRRVGHRAFPDGLVVTLQKRVEGAFPLLSEARP